jgi:hypothetical protein
MSETYIQVSVANLIANIIDREHFSNMLDEELDHKHMLTNHQIRVFVIARDGAITLPEHKLEALLKSALTDSQKFTVMVGDPVNGFECYGVFDDEIEAGAWRDRDGGCGAIMTIYPKD